MSGPLRALWIRVGWWKMLAAVLLLTPLWYVPCAGQLLESTLSVSARPFEAGMDCSTAPAFCMGGSNYYELGTYEFGVQLADEFEIREARFSLTWPSDWSLLEWSNCSSAIIDGDVTVSGAGIHMTFIDCQIVGETVLRLVFDCTTPGRFAMEDHPTEGEAAVLPCDHWWEDWFPEFNWWPHVEIGDYCGRAPESPCSVCDGGGLLGHFGPNQTNFDLELGQSVVDTILVYALDLCWPIPECGSHPSPCYLGTETNVEWISLKELSPPDEEYEHVFERTIRTEGLAFGAYSGRITIDGYGGGCCGSQNCEEITLTVRDPSPVETTTWGSIKARFK